MTNKNKIHVDDFLKSGFTDKGKTPGAHVWLNIEQKIAARNKKRRLVLYFVAALYLYSVTGLQQSPFSAIFASLQTETSIAPKPVSQKPEPKISSTPNEPAAQSTTAPVANAETTRTNNPNSEKSVTTKPVLPAVTNPVAGFTSKKEVIDNRLLKGNNSDKSPNPDQFSLPATSFQFLANPGLNFRYNINPGNLSHYFPSFSLLEFDTSLPQKTHTKLHEYIHCSHTTGLYAELGFNVVNPYVSWSIDNENKKFTYPNLRKINNSKAKNTPIIVPEINMGYHFKKIDLKVGLAYYNFDNTKNFYHKTDSIPFIIDANYGILYYRDTQSFIFNVPVNNHYSFIKIPFEITYKINFGKSFSLNTGIGSAIQLNKVGQQSYFNKLTYGADTTSPYKPRPLQDIRLLMSLNYRFPKSNTSLLFTGRYTYNIMPYERPNFSLFTSRMTTFELGLKLKYDF